MNPNDRVAQKIRLRQLRCFVTVARKKSFVLASRELGLTQPAVSRSVRELEQILGFELFDRKERGAKVTPRGQVLLEAAERGLLQIAQGISAATDPNEITDAVTIGALPNVCSQHLPLIVKTFKERLPRTLVRIWPGTNSELLDGLRRGEADVVIGRLSHTRDMQGLAFEHLFDEPLLFVVGRHHPLASEPDRVTLQRALEFPFLLPPQGTIIRQEASRFFLGEGAGQIADVIETVSSDFQRSYLRETDCIAVLPRGVVQPEIASGEIVRLPIAGETLKGPVGLTTNPEVRIGPAISELLMIIRSTDYSIT
ncbi:LysR substrate-binding domain-containing protein [Hoeflea sp.]|uniref:LysR substrate-binding domain-containing protein n=1 Tax=Hoeflea sp. TaxID=1940281 RepID=UPI003B0277AF